MTKSSNDSTDSPRLTRRDFLKLLKVTAIDAGMLAAGGATWSFLIEPAWTRIENVQLQLSRLAQEFFGMRIAQVSGIHMGGWMNVERLQHVIELVLEQKPDFADVSAKANRFDLQISGHSHGGQVIIPFYGASILLYLGQKYPGGLYRVGDMLQYTNRGVGMLDPPVRFNCPPEVTIFTLVGTM